MKTFLKKLFIWSYGTLTKVVPFLCYMFLVPFDDLYWVYWISYGFISFMNCMILLEVLFSFLYLLKEGDTRVRVSDIKKAKNVIQFPKTENDSSFCKSSNTRFGVILVGYIPNEYEVLPITVKHFMDNIILDTCELTLLLVYNGSSKMDKTLFENFKSEVLKYKGYNKKIDLILEECKESKSKAENINYGIDILKSYGVDYIGICDSDHWFHPYTFEIIKRRFLKDDHPDIVQGRCSIRQDGSFIAKMIAVDFDIIYTVCHKGGELARGYALFCGSNGYFKTDVIDKLRFDKDMLTEDIDLTFRALRAGYKIVYCRDAISSEESPPSWLEFIKQRTRWNSGWSIVTFIHTIPCCFGRKMPFTIHQRLATFVLLPLREFFEYLSFHVLLSAVAYFLRCNDCAFVEMFWLIIINMVTPLVLFYASVIEGLSGHQTFMKILFPLFSLPFNMLKSSIAITSHARLIVGIKVWTVTQRKKFENKIQLREIKL